MVFFKNLITMVLYKKDSKVLRDKRLRLYYKTCVGHIISLRSLNDTNSNKTRQPLIYRYFIGCKIHNRCLYSGRSFSIFSRFRVSRLKFRRLALYGFFPGVLKAL
jgi:ribosomal protein S14